MAHKAHRGGRARIVIPLHDLMFVYVDTDLNMLQAAKKLRVCVNTLRKSLKYHKIKAKQMYWLKPNHPRTTII